MRSLLVCMFLVSISFTYGQDDFPFTFSNKYSLGPPDSSRVGRIDSLRPYFIYKDIDNNEIKTSDSLLNLHRVDYKFLSAKYYREHYIDSIELIFNKISGNIRANGAILNSQMKSQIKKAYELNSNGAIVIWYHDHKGESRMVWKSIEF